MPQEVVGYTYTVWTCPSCGTKNPGPRKTCSGCGAAQPDNVQFEQAAQETLITDEAELAEARKGPDIHCPYCGTRNPADAVKCSQCGGDLTGGDKRAAGAVLGAHRDEPAAPVTCPSCGSPNPADAPRCSHCGAPLGAAPEKSAPPPTAATANKGCRLGLIIAVGLVLLGIIYGVISCWPRNAAGTVSGVAWELAIPIEELRSVQYQDWEANLPANAVIVSCSMKEKGIQDSPGANATKVCGTPYSRDLGNGRAEVVQDCEYHLYADYCRYTVQEWVLADTLTAEGRDYNPAWPRANLGAHQREGQRSGKYTVYFENDGKRYTFVTDDQALFQQAQPNTRWQLRISGSQVTAITPQ